MTALFLTSLDGHSEIVNALIEKGANVKAKVTNGMTALGAAKAGKHSETIHLLKKAGAKE